MRIKPGLGLGVVLALFNMIGCWQPTPRWNWERAEAGLPRHAVTLALAIDPIDPDRLWAGYYAPGGLATSQDGGETWTIGAQGLGDNPVFDLVLLSDGLLLAATRDGILQSTNGGAGWRLTTGGLPTAAAFSLAEDEAGQVYVGFDDAGLYVRDPSESRWNVLTHDEPLSTAAVISLAVSPDGTQLYAGTSGQGLFASRDAGHTWAAAFPKDYIPNLALNPSAPETAVASLRDRLARTHNGGESWEVLPAPWARDEVVSLLWLADSPGKINLITRTDGTLLAGSGQGQVYCSQDGGDSWVEMGARVPTQGGVLTLATAGSRLLAGTWTGIYARSAQFGGCKDKDNDGQAWTYLSAPLGAPYANTLLAAEVGLLIGTRTGLFQWQPGTRIWEKVPLQHPQGRDSPPGGVTTLASASSNRQIVYAGAATSGLYRSDDGGASWAQVPSELEIGIRTMAVSPNDPDHVYILAAWERVYESRDGGQNWQARWTGLGVTTEAASVAIDPIDPSIIYLGTDTGLYRSRYGGEEWRPVGRPLDNQTVLTLAALPAPNAEGRPATLYLGATRGAYHSHDAGSTVEVWGRGLEEVSVTAFLFDPNQLSTIYAGTAYAGLYRSVDGGETWHPFGPPDLADEVVEAMAWGPADKLFVASAGSVWVGHEIRHQPRVAVALPNASDVVLVAWRQSLMMNCPPNSYKFG